MLLCNVECMDVVNSVYEEKTKAESIFLIHPGWWGWFQGMREYTHVHTHRCPLKYVLSHTHTHTHLQAHRSPSNISTSTHIHTHTLITTSFPRCFSQLLSPFSFFFLASAPKPYFPGCRLLHSTLITFAMAYQNESIFSSRFSLNPSTLKQSWLPLGNKAKFSMIIVSRGPESPVTNEKQA